MTRSNWKKMQGIKFSPGKTPQWLACLAVLGSLVMSSSCLAQSKSQTSDPTTSSESIPSGIAWYGVLTDGIAEAKATNRPIMLLSAAPQCAGVPGMW